MWFIAVFQCTVQISVGLCWCCNCLAVTLAVEVHTCTCMRVGWHFNLVICFRFFLRFKQVFCLHGSNLSFNNVHSCRSLPCNAFTAQWHHHKNSKANGWHNGSQGDKAKKSIDEFMQSKTAQVEALTGGVLWGAVWPCWWQEEGAQWGWCKLTASIADAKETTEILVNVRMSCWGKWRNWRCQIALMQDTVRLFVGQSAKIFCACVANWHAVLTFKIRFVLVIRVVGHNNLFSLHVS